MNFNFTKEEEQFIDEVKVFIAEEKKKSKVFCTAFKQFFLAKLDSRFEGEKRSGSARDGFC